MANSTKKNAYSRNFFAMLSQSTSRYWHPSLSITSVSVIFSFFAVIFSIFGIALLSTQTYSKTIEYSVHSSCLNEDGSHVPLCKIFFEVKRDVKGKIYVYYQLNDFYQNHRIYVKSVSPDQIKGEDVSKDTLEEECSPQKGFVNGTYPNPCGIIYSSKFNDTFELIRDDDDVSINRQHVAVYYDTKFRYSKNFLGDVNSVKAQSAIVWMRPAGLPKFRKLYGVIHNLMTGNYTLTIHNNYPSQPFTKSFVLAQKNYVTGTNNPFLAWTLLVTGIVTGVSIVIILILSMTLNRSAKYGRIKEYAQNMT